MQGRGHFTFKGTISIMTDFSSETMETPRQWNNILKTLKENISQLRILYSMKILFKNEDKVGVFRQIKIKFITNRTTLQK